MIRTYLAAAALFAAAGSVPAEELVPYGATSVELGAFRGVAYYTVTADGYKVVTTIAEGETGLPVRFEATLADHQRLTISVPGKLGEEGEGLEIARSGETLILSRPAALSKALVVARPQASDH